MKQNLGHLAIQSLFYRIVVFLLVLCGFSTAFAAQVTGKQVFSEFIRVYAETVKISKQVNCPKIVTNVRRLQELQYGLSDLASDRLNNQADRLFDRVIMRNKRVLFCLDNQLFNLEDSKGLSENQVQRCLMDLSSFWVARQTEEILGEDVECDKPHNVQFSKSNPRYFVARQKCFIKAPIENRSKIPDLHRALDRNSVHARLVLKRRIGHEGNFYMFADRYNQNKPFAVSSRRCRSYESADIPRDAFEADDINLFELKK